LANAYLTASAEISFRPVLLQENVLVYGNVTKDIVRMANVNVILGGVEEIVVLD
jgi:hypothetical protein